MKTLRKMRLTLIITALFVMIASPALAAGGGHGEGFPWVHWGASMVNFAIFLGILYKFAWPKIKQYFIDRHANLTAELEEAKRLKAQAEAKVAQYEAKLKSMEDEREEMLDEYTRQGQQARDRIIEDAKHQVEKMRQDAEIAIDQEVKKAIAAIEQKAVDEALRMAQTSIESRLNGGEQNALVDAYISDLEQLGA